MTWAESGYGLVTFRKSGLIGSYKSTIVVVISTHFRVFCVVYVLSW